MGQFFNLHYTVTIKDWLCRIVQIYHETNFVPLKSAASDIYFASEKLTDQSVDEKRPVDWLTKFARISYAGPQR